MKRRKFIQNMLLAAAGTVIPVALLARMKKSVGFDLAAGDDYTVIEWRNLDPKPIIVQTRWHEDDLASRLLECDHDFYPWDWHCSKCGISAEMAAEKEIEFLNDDHVPPLKRMYVEMPPRTGKMMYANEMMLRRYLKS
jgi:hypothetical protein